MSVRLAGTGLRELRIHLCQKSTASAGVRQFVNDNYAPMKKANPDFPILVRECEGIVPSVWARWVTHPRRSIAVGTRSGASTT